ncbi:hypothetical protein FA743_03880 [Paracoccus gahaiensis]|uniref:Uncharacterized protein n=1 Tax=Paracoccus gahaiensis TaxID=1706839 RepID=A0A4V6WIT3_9RHOB|nr:hypothetical protein FA743_03880 [Paracoccus gahaiensis]
MPRPEQWTGDSNDPSRRDAEAGWQGRHSGHPDGHRILRADRHHRGTCRHDHDGGSRLPDPDDGRDRRGGGRRDRRPRLRERGGRAHR